MRAGCSTTFGASWSLRAKTCGPESALNKWASASLGNLMLPGRTRKVYGATLAQLVWACPAPLTPRLFLLVTCGVTLRLPSPTKSRTAVCLWFDAQGESHAIVPAKALSGRFLFL